MNLRDLRDDQPLTLPDAASYLGRLTGQKPHLSTIWRWCSKGCKGIRLESICIGGKRFVTVKAISRFIEASNVSNTGRPEQPPPSSCQAMPAKRVLANVMRHGDRRRKEIEAARRRLDEITGAAKPSALG